MQLDRVHFAEKAFGQQVDLQRLFVELVEGIAVKISSLQIGSDVRAISAGDTGLVDRVRSMDYDNLSAGKWKKVVFGDGVLKSEVNIFDNIESLILSFGRFVKINDANDLRIVMEALRIIDPSIPMTVFLQCLVETAVNQQLEADSIGMVEMRRVRSQTDLDLMEDNKEITRLTRGKIDGLLAVGT